LRVMARKEESRIEKKIYFGEGFFFLSILEPRSSDLPYH